MVFLSNSIVFLLSSAPVSSHSKFGKLGVYWLKICGDPVQIFSEGSEAIGANIPKVHAQAGSPFSKDFKEIQMKFLEILNSLHLHS